MKKILALALSLTLALSLCACGGDTTGDTAENTDTQQMETDVVEIPEVEDLTSTDTSTIPGWRTASSPWVWSAPTPPTTGPRTTTPTGLCPS